MAGGGNQGHWLAKARQLKEKALGTADRTRRKQFLLIATEYQKLARQGDGIVALNAVERMVVPANGAAPERAVVTKLRVAPQQTPPANSNTSARSRSRLFHALRQPEAINVAIWAFLALVAFGLLLIPGDQTAQGLQTVFELLER